MESLHVISDVNNLTESDLRNITLGNDYVMYNYNENEKYKKKQRKKILKMGEQKAYDYGVRPYQWKKLKDNKLTNDELDMILDVIEESKQIKEVFRTNKKKNKNRLRRRRLTRRINKFKKKSKNKKTRRKRLTRRIKKNKKKSKNKNSFRRKKKR